MKMITKFFGATLLVVVAPVHAQNQPSPSDIAAKCFAAGASPTTAEADLLQNALGTNFKQFCEGLIGIRDAGIESINEGINELAGDGVDLVYLGATDTTEAGLALKVDWRRNLVSEPVFSAGNDSGLSYAIDLMAKGTFAREQEDNPEDYAKGGVEFSLSNFFGGIDRESIADNAGEVWLARQRQVAAANAKPSEVDYFQGLRGNVLKDSWFVSADASYYVEGNQDFTNSNKVYGLQAGLAYTPVQPNWFTRLNPFDLPFKFTRRWSNFGKHWFGQQSIPAISIGYEQVDPEKDDARFAVLNNRDSYNRYVLKAGFKTIFGQLNGRDMTFTWDYQYYLEQDPEDSIEQAGMDRYRSTRALISLPLQAVFAAELPGDLQISYSSGRLPFDKESEAVYGLGWQMNFGDLGNLFSGLD